MRAGKQGLLALCLLLIGGCAAGLSLPERAALVAPADAVVEPAWRAEAAARADAGMLAPGGEAEETPPAGAPAAVEAAGTPVVPAPRTRQPGTANLRPPGTVPILMYHYIRVNPDPTDRIGIGLSVTPEDFAAQMEFLAARGYKTVLVRDLGGDVAARADVVALTFDDGYADAYEVVYPIMRRHGFKATFYVITALVGRPRYMSWDQIRALAEDGNAIGSHTVGHPDLRTLGASALQFQLRESRAEIERQVGRPASDLCYPSGSFSAAVRAAAGEAGYATAVTTRYGWYGAEADSLAMPRVRISGGTTLADFARLIGESAP